jgi:hypothetical protein
LQKEIVSALREVPVFTSVTRTSHTDPNAAREQGAHLLLKVSLSNCTNSFGGTNGYFIPNMLIWGILSPVVSAFVADEFFNVSGKVNAQLLDTATGETVWSHSITLQERYDLNDWQRGPTIWDFFFIAPFYNTWTPAKVDTVVLPHVIHKIQVELAKSILTDLPPPKRSFGVVVGLNSCGLDGAPELKYAEEDAWDLADFLEDSGFSEVVLLTGEEATSEAIESSLNEIAARTDVEVENLIVYFAGLGTTRFNKQTSTCAQALLTFGPRFEESEMTLIALLERVESIVAANKAIVIDAGFSGKGGRTYLAEEIPAGTRIEFPEAVSGTTNVAFLMSCGADETAHEFDSLTNGVFTHFLLQKGLVTDADLNKDGAVTIQEALKTGAWPVTRYVRSNMQGKSQKPCILGKDAAATRLLKLK